MAKRAKKIAREGLPTGLRFTILQRDKFECAYCGSRPGNDRLHVDHILPISKGGSDDPLNLISACDRCNVGKSDKIVVPDKMCDPGLDHEGFRIWKRFGDGSWYLAWLPSAPDMFLCGDRGYYSIDLARIHEAHPASGCETSWDWYEHIRLKAWATEERGVLPALSEALGFCRAIVRPPAPEKRTGAEWWLT